MTARPRVALLTARAWPEGDADDAPLVAALAGEGLGARWVAWDDAAVAAGGFDAALIRSCWDYTDRVDAFLDALDAAAARGVRVLNAPALVRWNAHKRYLADLEAAGIPVVPTLPWDGRDAAALARDVGGRGWTEIVLKPAVSAGARRTLRIATDALAAQAAAHVAEAPAAAWLVQPFREEIARDGEWSLVFFGGALSHVLLKRPARGDFRVQERHGGATRAALPPPGTVDAARRALDAARSLTGAAPLFARVDGIWHAGRFELVELEAIEPSLYLAHAPGAPARLARALAIALRRGGGA